MAYGPKEAWAILRFEVGLRGMASASQRLPDGAHCPTFVAARPGAANAQQSARLFPVYRRD